MAGVRGAASGARGWLAALITGVVLVSLVPACQPDRLRAPVALPQAPNFPDPTVFWAEGRFNAYATNTLGSSPLRLQVMTSPDLHDWTTPVEALTGAPPWAHDIDVGGRYWAPTAARFGSTYVLYFAAMHTSAPVTSPAWCVGWATSSSASGPFTPGPRPLLCQVLKHSSPSPLSSTPRGGDRGVIDPQVYLAPNGATYLHVKALDNPMQLWGMALAADGTSLRTQATGMLRLGAKEPVWEYSPAPDNRFTIAENPTMDHNPHAPRGYQYYLYYSGGDWRTAAYATGVAACQGPVGPCVRITAREPWLASRGDVRGPGGLSVFRAPGGARWVAYHSWQRGLPTSNGRRLHVEPLGYRGLTPVLLNRFPTGSIQVTADVSTVTLSGHADDPDTGRPMEVILKEGPDRVAVVTVGSDGRYSVTLDAAPGDHQYCAFVVDDNGLGTRWIGCASTTVAAGSPAGEDPAPSTTSTTFPTPLDPDADVAPVSPPSPTTMATSSP